MCVSFAATILVASGLRRRQGVLLSIINKSTTTPPSIDDDHHDHGRRLRTMMLSLRAGEGKNDADGRTTKTNIVHLRSIEEMQAVIDQSGRNRQCSSNNNSNSEEDNSNIDDMNTHEIGSRQGVEHEDNDDEEVVDQLVVVYFSSTNCPPCQKVSPLFTELAEEFDPTTNTQETSYETEDREQILSPQRKRIVFCKVIVEDDASSATADIATTYDVTGYPTFLFFKNGEKIMEIVGGNLAEATLYDWITILLASSSSSSSKKSSKTDDATSEF